MGIVTVDSGQSALSQCDRPGAQVQDGPGALGARSVLCSD